MTIGTRLFTWLHGRAVGHDAQGNRYFDERRPRRGLRSRRWVLYAGVPEASRRAAGMARLAALHDRRADRRQAAPAVAEAARAEPDRHGGGYFPPGHDYRGGQRPIASGDYEAWTPAAPDA